ncbi:MAG: sialidase family protein [Candidatus Dormibacteria bacterium]
MALPARAAAPSLPPGCHAEWPVFVHYSGGIPAAPATPPPVPCATETGQATSETTVAVTNRGSLIFSPSQTENTLGRSADQGRSWTLVAPAGEQPTALFNTVDPQVSVDRRTGRVFWVHVTGPSRSLAGSVPGGILPPELLILLGPGNGFQVYRSDDDGQSFATADYQTAPMGDWEKLFFGPPTRSGPKPSGYPNVVYVCANSPTQVTGPSRLCYRSLDGGITFSADGYVIQPGVTGICPPLGGNTGVVDSHGTVFQPQACQNGAYLAISGDEGQTYSWVPIGTAPPNSSLTSGNIQLAMDSADNLYVSFQVGDMLMLTISRDHGATWSSPISATAPGVHGVTLPSLSVGPKGAVGLTYYGLPRAVTAGAADAYITETTTALDVHPLWVSGMINDPAHPVYFAGGLTVYPRPDFIGGDFDAAGQFWAGIARQRGPESSDGTIQTTGYVSRLLGAVPAARHVVTAAASPLPNTSADDLRWVALPLLGVTALAVICGLRGALGLPSSAGRRPDPASRGR